jgi:hypothetical protein
MTRLRPSSVTWVTTPMFVSSPHPPRPPTGRRRRALPRGSVLIHGGRPQSACCSSTRSATSRFSFRPSCCGRLTTAKSLASHVPCSVRWARQRHHRARRDLPERDLPGLRREVHLGAQAVQSLAAHAWPGSVRELHNAIEQAAHIKRRGEITAPDLHLKSSGATWGTSLRT